MMNDFGDELDLVLRFVDTLTTEEEDRVLTKEMLPGSYDSPCLVGCAWGLDTMLRGDDGSREEILRSVNICDRIRGRNRALGIHSLPGMRGWHAVECAYDALCMAVSHQRVNAVIRDHIMENRVRRTLTTRAEAVAAC